MKKSTSADIAILTPHLYHKQNTSTMTSKKASDKTEENQLKKHGTGFGACSGSSCASAVAAEE